MPATTLLVSTRPTHPVAKPPRLFCALLVVAGAFAVATPVYAGDGPGPAQPAPAQPAPVQPAPQGGGGPAKPAAPPKAKKGKVSAASVAGGVQQFYQKTTSYQARFKQSYRAKVQNIKKVSAGQVVFAKPGKISFRYKNGNRVVSDGKVIKIYDADNKQMYRSKVKRSQYPAALAFLFGDGKLSRDFTLRLLDAKRMRVKKGWVLEAIPKDATPAYRKLLLYVDGASHQVRRVLVLDAQGNRNRFDFSAAVLNKKIAKKEFRFKPPKGTKVVNP